MVLTVSFGLFPVIGLFVTVIGGILPADLTPASRRQNHTTSPSASRAVRQRHLGVHRIPPRVRDDRERPSVGRDDSALLLFLAERQEKLLKFRNCFSVGWVKRSDHMTGFATPFFHLSSWMRRQAQTPE